MRTGFVYSLFTMLIMGLVLTLSVTQFESGIVAKQGEKLRIDEVSYFLDSITDDLDRATSIIGRRALTALTNTVVNEGEYINDSEPAFTEAYINGTVNGSFSSIMEQSTINNWTDAMQDEAAESGYVLEMDPFNISVGVEDHMRVTMNASYRVNLTDPVSTAQFRRNVSVQHQQLSIEGIEDPLILAESVGRYANLYNNCSTPTPARQFTGGDWYYDDPQNWTSGEAVTRPGNGDVSGVADKGEKIAVVEDLCSYSDLSDFSGFAGVVSEQPAIDGSVPNSQVDACSQTDVSINAVVDDASDATTIQNGSMSVMTEEQAWQNNIHNWSQQGCYFDDPWAPSFWDRLEGRFSRPTHSHGLAFLLTIPDLPSELQEANRSAVTYVYFNTSGDYGETQKIKGVTNEGRSWFRLDQDHIDYWGITPLTYN